MNPDRNCSCLDVSNERKCLVAYKNFLGNRKSNAMLRIIRNLFAVTCVNGHDMAIILMPRPSPHNDGNDDNYGSGFLLQRKRPKKSFGNTPCETETKQVVDEHIAPTAPTIANPTRCTPSDVTMIPPNQCGILAWRITMWFMILTALGFIYPQHGEMQLAFRQQFGGVVPTSLAEPFRMLKLPVVGAIKATTESSSALLMHDQDKKMRSCQDRLQPTSRTSFGIDESFKDKSTCRLSSQVKDEDEKPTKNNKQVRARYSHRIERLMAWRFIESGNLAWFLVCNFLLTTSILALYHCSQLSKIFPSTASNATPPSSKKVERNEESHSNERKDASNDATVPVTCRCCCSPSVLKSPPSPPSPHEVGTPKMRLKDFLKQTSQLCLDDAATEPIADLFPQTTVMFADIAGFTAWSSEREPAQVFMLLESLYRAFDDVASEMGVFKLDTIGDCYIAVAGFPDPIEDHGMLMIRYALECRKRMIEVTRNLEVLLGPDTADLAMRFGIHSGPVTAGVLRGKHARFQLLGDTVNLAAQMEYTGSRDCIQISQDTADFLVAAGKSNWITPRDDPITVKGRGKVQTFWLRDAASVSDSFKLVALKQQLRTPLELQLTREDSFRVEEMEATTISGSSNSKATILSDESQPWGCCWDESLRSAQYSRTALLLDESLRSAQYSRTALLLEGSQRWGEASLDNINFITVSNKEFAASSDREQRWIDWITKILLRHLKKVLVQRAVQDTMNLTQHSSDQTGSCSREDESLKRSDIFSEVVEIITLPRFDARMKGLDAEKIEVPVLIQAQLREYVTRIASMYRDNPFHNFEHASHVTMSVNKLLKRIVSPDQVSFGPLPESSTTNHQAWDMVHDSTFGIASDSLTQIAVVFSALIHDVDHQGVPNAQLVKEKSSVSVLYHDKSVAEQNSVDIAWKILLEPHFGELWSCICATEAERKRFRQLVVNCVLATDIVDDELQLLRKRRRDKAFHNDGDLAVRPSGLVQGRRGSGVDNVDRKATIVIEHIIQASDVAHTMQHWHIYVKWNERLFQEMYGAYLRGRADKDPFVGWYQGELAFFDHYIIPLARKLKECGVFGVSGEEYLNYALENRTEWKHKGQEICNEWKETFVHNIQE